MWRKLKLIWSTIQYLKFRQIHHQLFYRFRNMVLGTPRLKSNDVILSTHQVASWKGIPAASSYLGENTFHFLNIEHKFKKQIDWNYSDYGKLWTYNLNYFEYLTQSDISKEEGLALIKDFLHNASNIKTGAEPYPISLRIINWIKFINHYQIDDASINSALYHQIRLLETNLEYHLMGNHLLENAFALVWGSWYIKDTKSYYKSTNLLIQELNEQILPDGGHFELSPMYHRLILLRLLDTINLLKNNLNNDPEFTGKLSQKAGLMVNWLNQIKYRNNSLPNLNDSTFGIASHTRDLFNYAIKINIPIYYLPLNESGYRRLNCGPWELTADIGHIGPDYIPGHAHSDTLSFDLQIDDLPFIVDIGISTYEKNERRQWERSTAAHNTVQVDNIEQSEVWGGFKVGRRARPIHIIEKSNCLEASHDGYKKWNIYPYRKWSISDTDLEILDRIVGDNYLIATARYYLHPSQSVSILDNTVQSPLATFTFKGAKSIQIIPYEYPLGYNRLVPGHCITVTFYGSLLTWISR